MDSDIIVSVGSNTLLTGNMLDIVLENSRLFELPEIIKAHMEGKIDLDRFITHRMSIDDINEAIELQNKGESLRDIITFS